MMSSAVSHIDLDESMMSGSVSKTKSNTVYFTKMKTIPKITISLHGKLELSDQAKQSLNSNRNITSDDCKYFLKE